MHATRFRPTPNGPLHLGGAFIAERNWRAAQQLQAEFVLIGDDTAMQAIYGQRFDRALAEAGLAAILDDLAWLGLAPDRVVWSSEFAEAHLVAGRKLGLRPPGEWPLLLRYVHNIAASGATTSYHPWLIMQRVVDDHELGVVAFVRGADLLPECAMYDHLGRMLYGEGYAVRQDYLPLFATPSLNDKLSKSALNTSWANALRVCDCRALGFAPADILAVLRLNGKVPAGDPHEDAPFLPSVDEWPGVAAMRYVRVPDEFLREYAQRCSKYSKRRARHRRRM